MPNGGNGRKQPEPGKVWQHSLKVKEIVHRVFLKRPQTVGDDRLLIYEVWKRYGVKINFNPRTKHISWEFKNFEHMRRVPSPETICRRGRELREADRMREAQGFERTYSRTPYSESKRETTRGAYFDYYGGKPGTVPPLSAFEGL